MRRLIGSALLASQLCPLSRCLNIEMQVHKFQQHVFFVIFGSFVDTTFQYLMFFVTDAEARESTGCYRYRRSAATT